MGRSLSVTAGLHNDGLGSRAAQRSGCSGTLPAPPAAPRAPTLRRSPCVEDHLRPQVAHGAHLVGIRLLRHGGDGPHPEQPGDVGDGLP